MTPGWANRTPVLDAGSTSACRSRSSGATWPRSTSPTPTHVPLGVVAPDAVFTGPPGAGRRPGPTRSDLVAVADRHDGPGPRCEDGTLTGSRGDRPAPADEPRSRWWSRRCPEHRLRGASTGRCSTPSTARPGAPPTPPPPGATRWNGREPVRAPATPRASRPSTSPSGGSWAATCWWPSSASPSATPEGWGGLLRRCRRADGYAVASGVVVPWSSARSSAPSTAI